jgi:hypothetical protein
MISYLRDAAEAMVVLSAGISDMPATRINVGASA